MDQELSKSTSLIPFLKWPGGKRWLISQNPSWFTPAVILRHLEPFLGGAAAFFHAAPNAAVLTDSNEELICTYKAVRDDHKAVMKHLKHHHQQHSTSYYYQVRASLPWTDAARAARFIYLNRTCFNGLYRVNLKGEFNVPIGTKQNVILPTDDFERVSKLLQAATLDVRDFEETVAIASKEDLLYIDPPYTVKHNNNNFIKYNEKIFSWSDQVRLAKAVLKAAKRGAHVLISNADHPSVRDLYNDQVWILIRVNRVSKLASDPQFRRPTTELVISNYLSKDGQLVAPRF